MRIPAVLQSDRMECGLACLAMVAAFYGHRRSMREYRGEFQVSQRGTTLSALRDCGERIGFQCRGVRAELKAIGDLQIPAILHWNMDHFVVLESVGTRYVRIVDPAAGRRRLTWKQVSECFTGVAMEMVPTAALRSASPVPSIVLRDFLPALRGLGGSLSGVFLATLALQSFTLALPLNIQLTVDHGVRQGDVGVILAIALGFASVVFVAAITDWLRKLLMLYVGNSSAFRIVAGLARHLMRLPDSWFVAHHTGDVMSRFDSTRPVRDFMISGAFAILVDGLVAFGALLVLLLYSLRLAFVALCFLILLFALRYGSAGRLSHLTRETINAGAHERSAFIENVERQRAIKLLGASKLREDLWMERYVESINTNTRLARFVAHVDFAGSVLTGLESIVILALGAMGVIGESFTLGMLFAFVSYANLLSVRAQSFIGSLVEFRLLRLHRERIGEIASEELEQGGDRDLGHRFDGLVEAQDISFSYDRDGPLVLERLQLQVKPGEFVAITGRSGVGKSTVIKLLSRLLLPQAGTIRVDGVDVRNYGVRSYRSNLGVVMQDDDLFTGSILDNIAMDQTPDLDRVREAASIACVDQEIEDLPMGYHTLVGHMGAALSGGQKQRIMIARAVYRAPSIILLDEGTAHLNEELQHRVLQNLRMIGATILAATHDALVVQCADRQIGLN